MIQHVAVKNGEAMCPIKDCGIAILVKIDRYKSLLRTGGCCHVVSDSIESKSGEINIGYMDDEE